MDFIVGVVVGWLFTKGGEPQVPPSSLEMWGFGIAVVIGVLVLLAGVLLSMRRGLR